MNTQDDHEMIVRAERELERAPERARKTVLLLIAIALLCVLAVTLNRAHAETVSLKCTTPTQNTDGSALTDFAGINWLYGPAPDKLLPLVTTPGCSHNAANLTPGTWYFAAQAFTEKGAQSANSNIVSKTIAVTAVDCVVSAYGAWSTPAWSACASGTQTRQETRTRTIVTQPSGGGQVCPGLTETRTATQACAAPMLLTTGGSVYVATPNYTVFGWKLGAVAGTIPAKIKCDSTRKIGVDYFRVTSAITWTSGAKNYVVAKCSLQ